MGAPSTGSSDGASRCPSGKWRGVTDNLPHENESLGKGLLLAGRSRGGIELGQVLVGHLAGKEGLLNTVAVEVRAQQLSDLDLRCGHAVFLEKLHGETAVLGVVGVLNRHRSWNRARNGKGNRIQAVEVSPKRDEGRLTNFVELRLFGGLTIVEIARTLGISPRSVDGELAHARAWLRRQLGRTGSE